MACPVTGLAFAPPASSEKDRDSRLLENVVDRKKVVHPHNDH